jgi:hypothetical protein
MLRGVVQHMECLDPADAAIVKAMQDRGTFRRLNVSSSSHDTPNEHVVEHPHRACRLIDLPRRPLSEWRT